MIIDMILIIVINGCYDYTDDDRVWKTTYAKTEKEMCERHEGNTFYSHEHQRKRVRGCGNECSCCEKLQGNLAEIRIVKFVDHFRNFSVALYSYTN